MLPLRAAEGLLRAYGVSVSAGRAVTSEDAAVAAADEELGYPVALKANGIVRRGHERLARCGQLRTQLLDEAGREDDGLAGSAGHAADVRRGGAQDPWDAEPVARGPSRRPPRPPPQSRGPG